MYVGKTDKVELTDKEKAEFDHISFDGILQMADINKLRKLEAYMRQEGFAPTAQAARNRLKDLGNPVLLPGDPELAKAQEELQKEAKAEYLQFLGEIKERDQALMAASSNKVGLAGEGAAVPVRTAPEPEPAPKVAQLPPQPKGDSTLGGQVRSGTDYYSKWDKLAKEMEEDEDEDGVKAKVKEAVKADHAADAPPAVMGKGAVERLSKANMSLSQAERDVLAMREKEKGNDLFRAREFTSAVAAYTLSLELSPGNPAVLANRAAVHMKLKNYKDAEADCGAALDAQKDYFKAYLRRAACRMELKNLSGALEDAAAGLEIDPECKELQDIHSRATSELERNSMKRLTIEEVSDGEESDDDAEEIEMEANTKPPPAPAGEDFLPCPEWGGPLPGYYFGTGAHGTGYYLDPKQPQPSTAEPAAAAAAEEQKAAVKPVARTRIVVEEEDEDDEEEEKDGEKEEPAKAKHPEAATPAASAAVPVKKKIVVEEEDDDEEEDDGDEEDSAPIPEVEPEEASLSDQAEALKTRGNKLFGEGKLQEAADTFSRALRLTPANAVLLNNRSACRLRLDEKDAAETDAGVAAVLDESYGKAWLRLGQCRRSQGRLGAALATFQEALSHLPDGQKSVAQREIAEVNREIAKRRKQSSSASARSSPSSNKATYNKGTVEIEEIDSDDEDAGDNDEAINEKFPDGDVLAHFRTDAAARERDAAKAQADWDQRRAAREQRLKEAATARSKAKQAKSNTKAAQAKPADASKPSSPVAAAASKPAATASATRPAVDIEALKLEGNAAFKKGDMRAAEAAWGSALVADPTNAAILANRAMLFLKIGNFEGCIADCETVLASDSNNVKALHRRAKAKQQLGKLDEALAEYETLQAKLPGLQQVSEELAALRQQIKEEKEAQEAHMEAAWEALGEQKSSTAVSHAKPALVKQPEGPSTPPKAASPRVAVPVKVEVVSDDEDATPEPAGTRRGEPVVSTRQVEVEIDGKDDKASAKAPEPAAAVGRRKIIVEESDEDDDEPTSAPPVAEAPPARRKIVVEESDDEEEDVDADKGRASEPAANAPDTTVESVGNRRKIVVEEEDEDSEEEAVQHASASTESQPIRKKIVVEEEEDDGEEEECNSAAGAAEPAAKQEKADPAAVAALKDAGNASFKAGNMQMAIASYNAAISIDPSEPALYANRAMAHLKLGDYKACEADCRYTIKLEPGHIKARHRLATALRHQGSLEEAADLLTALRKDLPGNNAIKDDFDAVSKLMQEEREALDPVSATTASSSNGTPPAATTSAPSEATTNNPSRRKIPVVEEDSSDEEEEEQKDTEKAGTAETVPQAPPSKAAVHQAAAAKAAAAIRMQQAAASTKLPPVPKSATEFERTAKTMSSDPPRLAEYVQQMDPAQLPAIFKSSLSASSIGFVAQAISKGRMLPDKAALASDLLTGLTQCDRFAMTAMLISRNDKAVIKEAIDGLKEAGVDVTSLKKQYKA